VYSQSHRILASTLGGDEYVDTASTLHSVVASYLLPTRVHYIRSDALANLVHMFKEDRRMRVAAGDKDSPKYQQQMDKLLKQLNRGGKRPIKPASYESKAIIEKLADRFDSDAVSKSDLQATVAQLLVARRTDFDRRIGVDRRGIEK